MFFITITIYLFICDSIAIVFVTLHIYFLFLIVYLFIYFVIVAVIFVAIFFAVTAIIITTYVIITFILLNIYEIDKHFLVYLNCLYAISIKELLTLMFCFLLQLVAVMIF